MLGRVLTAVTFLLATATGSITNCNSNSVFKPTRLALYPDPPVHGKPVDMIVEFENPGAEVHDGTVKTSLSLNYIPIAPSTKPLCEDTECPLVTGFNNRSTSSVWPDTVSGKVSSKIVWTSPEGASLLCIQMVTTVGADKSKALTLKEMWRHRLHASHLSNETNTNTTSTPPSSSATTGSARRNLRSSI
jgi:hypothetical protein